MSARGFIVTWDDGAGVCCVMGADPDRPGAICGLSSSGPKKVKVFPDRRAARKAIRMSSLLAELEQMRGEKAVNTDFLSPASKCLKIVPVDLSDVVVGESK